MTLAPWRLPLARALHHNRALPYARYFQLATVEVDRPANRTVVFRGFLPDTNQLKIITDRRSQKAEQIARSPWGEACWYFPKTREQFRLAGRLTLIQETDPAWGEARQAAWQELSDAARTQFSWPEPGAPRIDTSGFDTPLPDATHPLANFCLLLLEPEQVDHLELKGNPQNRSRFSLKDGTWTILAVNP